MLGVDLGRLDPGLHPFSDLPVMALGAAITASAFAFAAYAPPRSLLPIAVIGGVAGGRSTRCHRPRPGVAWASAMAAVLIGLVSYAVAGRVRVPPLVVVVSSIVPLLPGLSIYRGLSLLSEGGNGLPLDHQRRRDRDRAGLGRDLRRVPRPAAEARGPRLEGRLSGPRLVGPLRVRSVRRRTVATDPR